MIESRFTVREFSGGINTSFESWQIPDNAVSSAKNMVITKKGAISSTPGVQSLGTAVATGILGLFSYYVSTTKYMVRMYSTQVEYTTNPFATTVTWTNIETLSTGGARMGAVQYNDVIWYDNGVDDFRSWNGTSVTTYATAPKGNIMAMWRSQCFKAGNTTNPSTLYYSDIDAPQTWAGGSSGSLTVNKKDGQKITGIVPQGDALIVYKERSTYKITYEFDDVTSTAFYKVTPISEKYGCVAFRTATAVDNDTIAFSNFGVVSVGQEGTYSGLRTNSLSESIRLDLRGRQLGGAISSTYADLSAGAFFEGQYFLSVPVGTATTPSSIYLYDSLYGAWMFLEGLGANIFCMYRNSALEDYLFFGSADGKIYYFARNNNFDGNGFTKSFSTKRFDFGNPLVKKEMYSILITGSKALGSTIHCEYIRDYSIEEFVIDDTHLLVDSSGGYIGENYFGEAYFGSSGVSDGISKLRFQRVYYPNERTFSELQLTFSNDVSDEPYTIDSIGGEFATLDLQETASANKT